MSPRRARSVPPRTSRAGFTLVEIVFAIAIVATVFVALIGLLPVGLSTAREAADATRVGTVLEDVQSRMRGEKLQAGPASFSPAYYDADGAYLSSLQGTTKPFYRVETTFGTWATQPGHTSGLQPALVAVYWPVDGQGQTPPAAAPKIRFTFPVAPLTGPAWIVIDPNYVPKFEF